MQGKYLFINKPELKLISSDVPAPYARCISPFDSEEIKKDKEEFPFKQRIPVDFKIVTANNTYNFLFEQYRNDEEGFKYDGTSLPWGIKGLLGGKGNPRFLIPAFFHDIFCNHKELLGRDRYLSSVIFKELLLANKVNGFLANTMFFAVDNFQKFQNW